jgi:hypothetical protein
MNPEGVVHVLNDGLVQVLIVAVVLVIVHVLVFILVVVLTVVHVLAFVLAVVDDDMVVVVIMASD